MPDKKILILYATAGAGHKKAAEALGHGLKERYPGARLADIIDYIPSINAKLYNDGYSFLIKHFPGLWGFIYFLSDTPYLSLVNVVFRKFFNRLMCGRFIKMLMDERPDQIISTHFLTSEIVSYCKKELGLGSLLTTVITDFGVHNFWIEEGTDIYCCASESTKDILLSKGMEGKKIKVTGVPLDEKFLKIQDKRSICTELGLESGVFTSLIITGGIGAGPIEEIVDDIREMSQVLVVCGNNKRLYDRLVSKNYKNVKVFGFIDFVEKLMTVSDIVITKAGGLTITESLAKEDPMIFFFLIPGQESINALTICSGGAGLIATKQNDIKRAVLGFKSDPEMLKCFREKAKELSRPDSVKSIVSLLG
ncbi:MAG TPA: glycosyltransferase [Candidatus Omnitrophota bacterium]|nr:glycosyltransferase [Candidatus Omnitrophota bacterium]